MRNNQPALMTQDHSCIRLTFVQRSLFLQIEVVQTNNISKISTKGEYTPLVDIDRAIIPDSSSFLNAGSWTRRPDTASDPDEPHETSR